MRISGRDFVVSRIFINSTLGDCSQGNYSEDESSSFTTLLRLRSG